MKHYWNEFDPYAAAWLRNLIDAGELPPGDVDTRSIKDVTANDVRGYRQCHFFAGGAGWSFALRYAGWPDDRPVWTGSCPCQPFSPAGKGKGKADERHLWPVFFRLINAVRPACVFGEQVPAAVKHGWLDDLCDDLEGVGYTTRAIDLPACSIGSPTIRQRLWWGASRVSDAGCSTSERNPGRLPAPEAGERSPHRSKHGNCSERPGNGGATERLSDAERSERRPHEQHQQLPGEWNEAAGGPGGAGADGWLSHAGCEGPTQLERQRDESARLAPPSRFSAAACDWLDFLDGKTRPIEPGLECLVDGAPFRLADGRTGRATQSRAKILKVIGNAILPEVGAAFIRAYCEVTD